MNLCEYISSWTCLTIQGLPKRKATPGCRSAPSEFFFNESFSLRSLIYIHADSSPQYNDTSTNDKTHSNNSVNSDSNNEDNNKNSNSNSNANRNIMNIINIISLTPIIFEINAYLNTMYTRNSAIIT